MMMMKLSSILPRILASAAITTTAVVACGGQTAGTDLQGTSSSSSSSSGSSSGSSKTGSSSGGSSGTTPPTPPNPLPDAGIDTGVVDSGSCAPTLLKSPNPSCADIWHQPCGIPAGVDTSDGLDDAECAKLCGPKPGPNPTKYWGCGEYMLDDLPGPSFNCYTCIEGRRPQGYVEPSSLGGTPTVAGWLAHAADLERVSIDAFQILGRELRHYAAPSELIARARDAEADEVQHARILAALARREGATLEHAPIAHNAVRALVDIALENAVEGCVRETYGALVAGHQAEHATRMDIRRVMKRIYRDETSHAQLAWDVHAWIMEQLTSEERERVVTATQIAIAELAMAARADVCDDLVSDLGLPSRHAACVLVNRLEIHLFVPAIAA